MDILCGTFLVFQSDEEDEDNNGDEHGDDSGESSSASSSSPSSTFLKIDFVEYLSGEPKEFQRLTYSFCVVWPVEGCVCCESLKTFA